MKGFSLDVCGSYACFTRPEMKVERVSYDVITPSAARAIFEAILWKPAIRWRVTRIEVLAPIRWTSIRRNEVGKTASPRSDGLFVEDERTQRAGLVLRDVKYRLFAEFDFIPPDQRTKSQNPVPEWLADNDEIYEPRQSDKRADETEAKYAAMFERRATKGQCFTQPYLGCREFSCDFSLVSKDHKGTSPISETRDLGWMIYDLDFSDPDDPKPMLYRPMMNQGCITVPHPDSREVHR